MSRKIPFSVLLSLFFGRIPNQIGWLFIGIGMFFVWIFASHPDLSFFLFIGPTGSVAGKPTNSRATDYSVGVQELGRSSRTRQSIIYAYDYEFTTPDGVKRKGISYSSSAGLASGSEVEILYLPYCPSISRIRGRRGNIHDVFSLFAWFFPGLGLLIVALTIKFGIKALGLLRNGVLIEGTLGKPKKTGSSAGGKVEWECPFSFVANDGNEYQTSQKVMLEKRLKMNSTVQILYNSENPNNAIITESLPGKPIVEDKTIQALPTGFICGKLVIPFIAIVANGAYGIYEYFLR